jgi:hypothetical protein
MWLNSPMKPCFQMCKSQQRDTKYEKNKSTYLPPKVTTPKYYLKWRWSAFNPRENSKDYMRITNEIKYDLYLNTWINSKRKQIKRLKLNAQSWLRSPCLLLTGILGILLSMVATPYCECPRRQTWTWGFCCVTDRNALCVQVSCHNCSCRSQHQTWWSIQRPCPSPVLSIWQVITLGPRSAST